MKALVITSVASMVEQFLYASVKQLKEMGYEVTVSCNFVTGNTCTTQQIVELKDQLRKDGIKYRQIAFSRDIKRIDLHAKAYKQVKELLKEDFQLIHCHSPIGGLITRLAVGKKHKVRVIYTAHGFHFYKGAPLVNWLVFYPIEYLTSFRTDVLITINEEDYKLAKRKLHPKEIVYIPGVGIDTKSINERKNTVSKRKNIRKTLGISDSQFMLLSVGELNRNKNHIAVIRALGKIYHDKPRYLWKYVICGIGKWEESLRTEAEKLGISNNVRFLGYRDDVLEIMYSADLFIHPSLREGLSVALMEAIACKCPVICSDVRGNRDIVDERMLFDPRVEESIVKLIRICLEQRDDKNAYEQIKNSVKKNSKKLEKCELSDVRTKNTNTETYKQ